MRCPDGAVLAAWVDGEVVGPPAVAVDAHVARCARCHRVERTQRQVKRRTSQLRAEAGMPRPDPDLLSVLLRLPQTEHDRALRRAHRASSGESRPDGTTGTRLRVAVVGAGAAAWLVAAVWSTPSGPTPTDIPEPTSARGVSPTASEPAGPTLVSPVGRWPGMRPALAEQVAGR